MVLQLNRLALPVGLRRVSGLVAEALRSSATGFSPVSRSGRRGPLSDEIARQVDPLRQKPADEQRARNPTVDLLLLSSQALRT